MMEADWYYEDDGSRKGPVSSQEMERLIGLKQLGYGSSVWRSGFDEWMPLEKTELAGKLISDPPPLRADSVRDIWVWLLALSPVFALLIPETPLVWLGAFWGAVLGFIALDRQTLNSAGYSAPSVMWVLFIPGYIYLRAKRTRKHQAPVFAWILGFALSSGLAIYGFDIYAKLPECADADVQQLLAEIASEQGFLPEGQKTLRMTGIAETASSPNQSRMCTSHMHLAFGQMQLAYSITWSNQLFSEYYVQFEGF